MATSNLAAVSAALSLIFDAKLARQWNLSARTLSMLQAKPVGSKSINWDISTDGQTALTHVEGADVTAGELLINAKLPMVLQHGLYRNAFGLSEHQLEAAMTSRNSAEELMQLLEESVYESVAHIASKLNQDLFTGAGSGALVGFDNALIITGAYAGQTVDSVTMLKSTLDTNSNVDRALTLELMSKMESNIFVRSGKRPNLIVTSPEVMTKYKSLFEPIRRVVGDTVGRYDTSVQDDGVFFMGVPVIRDKDLSGTGKMYFLNTNLCHMAYMPPANFGDAVSFNVKLATGSNGADDEQATGIPIRVQSLAKTGDSVKFFLRTATQLVVRQPNAFGVITHITE